MASRTSRREWVRALPWAFGVGRYDRKQIHSVSERSVGYGFLIGDSVQNGSDSHSYQTGSYQCILLVATIRDNRGHRAHPVIFLRRMPDKRPTTAGILRGSERLLYYVAAVALIATVGFLCVSTTINIPTLLQSDGAFRTSITVLDRVLLLFIFAELLHSIRVILEEDRILVEPFLLIGIIAVIRRILLASAETTLSNSAEDFDRLIVELAVLSALVIALGVSFYLVRRVGRQEILENKEPES